MRVDVIDTGPGLLQEEFRRRLHAPPGASRGQPAASGGSGLGLSIVAGIVEAHGGRIWLESSVGQGSTFSFTLPSAPE